MHQIEVPRTKLDMMRNFFTVRVIEKWKSLTQELKEPKQIPVLGIGQQFKRRLNIYVG